MIWIALYTVATVATCLASALIIRRGPEDDWAHINAVKCIGLGVTWPLSVPIGLLYFATMLVLEKAKGRR